MGTMNYIYRKVILMVPKLCYEHVLLYTTEKVEKYDSADTANCTDFYYLISHHFVNSCQFVNPQIEVIWRVLCTF